MSGPAVIQEPIDDPTAGSLRSRASSIVTTTTKFSLETLQDDSSSILAFRERQHAHPANRPRSLLSMTSIARPAPPYGATLDSTLLLPSHQHGDFERPFLHPVEPTQTPMLDAAPSPKPSPPPSGSTTPSPDSPLDPEDPRAQITYYNNVVRTLDQNYTAELARLRAQHASELASIRNEIDAAYRAQWKAKNREIEKAKEEAAVEVDNARKEYGVLERALEQQREEQEKATKVLVEKARHEVEDVWEKRWRDRARLEDEERMRMEGRWRTRAEGRDERWRELMERVVREVDPGLCDRILSEIREQDDLDGNGTHGG
ncbi:MAG: hypothetical protein Q9219_004602 [cf. Caloplaca sp. 3 TL-2023]